MKSPLKHLYWLALGISLSAGSIADPICTEAQLARIKSRALSPIKSPTSIIASSIKQLASYTGKTSFYATTDINSLPLGNTLIDSTEGVPLRIPQSLVELEKSAALYKIYDGKVYGSAYSLSSLSNDPMLVRPLERLDHVMTTLPGIATRIEEEIPGTGPMAHDMPERCYWSASPFELEPTKEGYTPISYSRKRFSETGAILYRTLENGKIQTKICGFTLIDRAWAITALHCVSNQKEGKAELRDIQNTVGADAYFFLVPTNEEQKTLLNCIDDNKATRCTATQLSPIKAYKKSSVWVNSIPEVDLALIQLDTVSTQSLAFVRPQLGSPRGGAVTVAGYGATNVATDFSQLLVSWQKDGVIDIKNGSYVWKRTVDTNGGGQCIGDSGSSVLDGEFFGREYEQQDERLLAVMSYVYPKPKPGYEEEARSCLKPGAISGSVLLATHRDWICKTTNNIAGCEIASQ